MRMRNAAGTVVDVGDALAARLRRAGWASLETPSSVAGPEPVGLPTDKDALIALAEAEGISIDRRWGAQRLRNTISAARGRHG